MSRFLRNAALGLALLIGSGAAAHALEPLVKEDAIPGKFSANVGITSEYVFRGISQTDGVPALQGGFDYEIDLSKSVNGYAGVWASNVKFPDASVEMDIYGGIKTDISGVGLDVGFIYYAYPGAASALDYDFVEAKFALSYDAGVASGTAAINYSPEYFGDSGDAVYYALDLEVPIQKLFAIIGHIGYQTIEENAAFGTDDYVDFKIGAKANVMGFDLTLAYTDTDLPKSQCDDLCGIFTATLSRSF